MIWHPSTRLCSTRRARSCSSFKGRSDLLPGFRFIKTEVADFESYEGGCQLPEMDAFLTGHGFKRGRMDVIAKSPKGGKYYDVLYQRR